MVASNPQPALPDQRIFENPLKEMCYVSNGVRSYGTIDSREAKAKYDYDVFVRGSAQRNGRWRTNIISAVCAIGAIPPRA